MSKEERKRAQMEERWFVPNETQRLVLGGMTARAPVSVSIITAKGIVTTSDISWAPLGPPEGTPANPIVVGDEAPSAAIVTAVNSLQQ